ncbi:MAG: ATP-binding protein [Mucilaginibacter sp.]|uniref:hybrid sensor histidine kinase/response regulator transcription factor n=1 Tax=Mucilaginibacter sp. TaxID=1882438 RepID=UPI0031AB1A3E
MGTQRGLNVFNYEKNEFSEFKPEIFGHEFIYDMLEDADRELWFCTNRNGIIRYSPQSGRIIRYQSKGAPGELSSNQVVSVCRDDAGKLWFGTIGGGVCIFNKASGKFTVFNKKNGLPSNNVYGILEDKQQKMWFSTNHGLTCYNQRQNTFINFDIRSGLPSNQFNFRSALKAKDGTFYFGSINGVCIFDPLSIRPEQGDNPVRFTEFQLFNQTVRPSANGLLKRRLDDVGEINLRYQQNVFSIGYTTLNYSNVRENNYAYYLEGFEQRWNVVKNKYMVTYTNLSPGRYVFHLKALDIAGKAVNPERTLVVHVAPPFYLSRTAFVLYLLLIGLAIWGYARFLRFMNQKDMQLLEERKEKEKTAAINQHRLNFFTFISHEFKTPLTLIIASVEKFMSADSRELRQNSELPIIKGNANRLFNMVQQLMEFRKIETDHAGITLTLQDLSTFVKNTLLSFETLAANKQITLHYTAATNSYQCYFDPDKVEKIVFNIVSNAIKFTGEGTIEVGLTVNAVSLKQTEAVLTISDSGTGMQQQELDQLFEPFQTSQQTNGGSGIGMALVKSLVDMMSGKIEAISRPGAGTTIHVSFPVYTEPGQEKQVIGTEPITTTEQLYTTQATPTSKREHSVLIVEDNKELLLFLTRHLSANYMVIQAANGATGLNQVAKYIPDLVISDVKMPVMSGLEFCLNVKKDSRYNHIPVILLSDQSHEDNRIAGLDVGADLYLAKPFSLKELDRLIANMIVSRGNLRGHLLDTSHLGEEKKPRNNRDQQFMVNLNAVLEKHYANTRFSIEKMAEEMNMSRTLLHLNLKKLMGQSATQVLNSYRLKKAITLLKNGLPIIEVAYDCGYSDANYFSRMFKKHYEVSPGAFRASADRPDPENKNI